MVEELLQLLVRIIDAKLLKSVGLEFQIRSGYLKVE